MKAVSSRKGKKNLSGFPLELPRKFIHFIKPQDLIRLKQPWLYLLYHNCTVPQPFFCFSTLLALFQTNQPKKKCFIAKEPLINTIITLPKPGDVEATRPLGSDEEEALMYTGAAAYSQVPL